MSWRSSTRRSIAGDAMPTLMPRPPMRHAALAAAGILLAAAAAAVHAATAAVAIEKFAFAPREITIAPGTTLVWTNRDETPHAIAAQDSSFASKAMDTDDRYEYTFAHAGDFAYFCTLHPFMTGVVHVRADAASAPDAPPR